ncbi:MAG TPA: hypothetical protein VGO67_19700 [Verrucomicrobiae bacterium]|jgi:hypothetical protein
MKRETFHNVDGTPDQIDQAKRWVETWRTVGPLLEKIRRRELRELDPQRAVALLCGPANYRVPPRAPKMTSGLVEQQRFFKLAKAHD